MIGATPGQPTPKFFSTVQKCARQRHGCETLGDSFAVSLPHTLLFKMKGNTVSVAKWKILLRSRKHPGWRMVAKKGRARDESDFLLFLCWFQAQYPHTSFGGGEASALFIHSIL